ncbi:MAG: ribonuclease Y [Acidimicrobiia bacterium]
MVAGDPQNPNPYLVGSGPGSSPLGMEAGHLELEEERQRLHRQYVELAQTQRRLADELERLQHERVQLQKERGELYRTAERQAFEFQKQQELLAAERGRLEQEREKLFEQVQRYLDSWTAETQAKRTELYRAERELGERELALERRERAVRAEEARLIELGGRLTEQSEKIAFEIQRIAGMTPEEAKKELRDQLFEQAKQEEAANLEAFEERVKKEADKRAAIILANAMQRLAGSVLRDVALVEVQLPSDDFKSRIIGKDGRNIRRFEEVTGVDVILEVEDHPDRVALSCFNPLRREKARLCLEELLADGRIQPKRIEDTYENVSRQLEQDLRRAGQAAAAEFGFQDMHKEITEVLGRLKLWESNGQFVLDHLRESARLARMIAEELSVDPTVATRAALLHDIGKALRYERKGPHAIVGANFAREHGEDEAVCHAIEAHHNEVPAETVAAVLVQVVDRLSGGRPGARVERSNANYVERLEELEEFCRSHRGVRDAYAFKAGREIRVIVDGARLNDIETRELLKELKASIERDRRFQNNFELTVIREYRITENVWG